MHQVTVAGDTVLMGPRVQEPAVSDGEIENKRKHVSGVVPEPESARTALDQGP